MSTLRTCLVPIVVLSTAVVGCANDDGSAEARASSQAHQSEEVIPFKTTKLLVEHNATDEDTGFQGFVDGEPWKRLQLRAPDSSVVLQIHAQGGLKPVGLTELFFETNEPPNAEVPIPEMLANLPEGEYEFVSRTVDGIKQNGVATLSHKIPAGPVIISPCEDAVVSADRDLVFQWNPVTTAVHGGTSVNITHYQLIVNKLDQVPGPGFGSETLSIHVPASVTTMRVPHEFLMPDTKYEFEVIAIEENGNQTLSTGEVETE